MRTRLGGVAGPSYVAVAAIAALALLFSTTRGTSDLAHEAFVVQHAEATLSAAVAVRASLGEALVIGEAARAGVATAAAVAAAKEKVEMAAAVLESRTQTLEASLPEGDPELVNEAAALAGVVVEGVGLLSAGSVDEAVAMVETEFEPAHGRLVRSAERYRDSAAARLAASDSASRVVADVARFGVAFALPVLALLGYRELMRRRVRESELIAMLGSERELSRSKDEFIANISHELRTPLTSIYGFSRVLEEDGFDDPETALDLVNLIISESSELSRMVDDLLTAARADAGVLSFEIEEVEVESEVREVVAPFNRMGPSIQVDCEPALIRADPLRLRQVIRNLVSNGRRHGGSRIRVIGRPGERGWFEVTVSDDGPGVRPDMEDRLFQRFSHRGREAVLAGGLGIGLSIVRMLAEEMGGRVEYERREEETRFTVRLPLARSAGRLDPTTPDRGKARRNLPLLADDLLMVDLLAIEAGDGWLVGEPEERER